MRKVKKSKKHKRNRSKAHIVIYGLYSAAKFILRTKSALPILIIASLGGWIYYSGEYDAVVTKVDEAQSKASQKLGLNIKDILLEGQVHTPKEDILGAITNPENYDKSVQKSESIFDINLWKAKERLEDLTWVKYASVERQYPSTLSVRITERLPVALWQDSGKIYLIDEEGKIITEKNLENFSNLIIMIGKDVPTYATSLLQMVRAEATLSPLVSSATRISKRRWDIKLYNGILIKLPEEAPEKAWSYLASTNEETQILKGNVKTIDLRVEDKMFVQ